MRLEDIAALGHKEHWMIKWTDIRPWPEEILGMGSFGVVLAASYHGTIVAMKLCRASGPTNLKHLPSFTDELRSLRLVRHQNIVLFHGACMDPGNWELALVMEYVEGPDLSTYIADRPTTEQRHAILLDVCCALRYLHAQKPCIVHGDLKDTNIIVEGRMSGPRAKLVDFGLSRVITRHARPLGGTLRWMAPEVILRLVAPSSSADVFSFGSLAYFTMTGLRPLAGMLRHEVVAWAKQSSEIALDWTVDSHSTCLLSECRLLSTRCMAQKLGLRPTMQEVHVELFSWPLPDSQGSRAQNGRQTLPAEVNETSALQEAWRASLMGAKDSPPPAENQRKRSSSAPASWSMGAVRSGNGESGSPGNDMQFTTGDSDSRLAHVGSNVGSSAARQQIISSASPVHLSGAGIPVPGINTLSL